MTGKKKILVADDSPTNLDFLAEYFSKHGFVVEKATDGKDALRKVKRFSPDLLLLDNIMPLMTGLELVAVLKNKAKYKKIPIIMFSAVDDAKTKAESLKLGIKDYITKPINFSDLLARIKKVFEEV